MNWVVFAKRLSAVVSRNGVASFRLCPTIRLLSSTYKSSISLQNLYPSSSLRLTTPTKLPESKNEEFSGYIPMESLVITYSRSSGPGGQNVNMVNTKVDVRFHVESAEWLSKDLRAKILDMHKTRVSKEGFLVVRSDKTRSQQINLADAMERLRELIRKAEFVPPEPSPETEEMIRRRKAKANRERLIEKRMKSVTKAQRQAPEVNI